MEGYSHKIYNISLLIENKLIICALGNLHYKFSREKFEPEPGLEPRSGISRGLFEGEQLNQDSSMVEPTG